MNKYCIVLLFISGVSIAQQSFNEEKDKLYIKQFAKIAVEEMYIYKIPASIKLGQGLLETADGQSELAINANNHFGIKCKKNWTGESYRYTDDAHMECFRKYASAVDSYKDHSIFLVTRKHYAPLFNLDIKDYRGWAYGLKKAGYATNKRYPRILISKIERYNLQNLDKLSVDEVDAYIDSIYPELKSTQSISEGSVAVTKVVPKVMPKKVEINQAIVKSKEIPFKQRIKNHKNKNLKYIVINSGETLNKISLQTGILVDKLIKYNDFVDVRNISSGQNIFLEKKRKKGDTKYYYAKEGDTFYSISQKEGIRLEKLRYRNKVTQAYTPKSGEKIYLRGRK